MISPSPRLSRYRPTHTLVPVVVEVGSGAGLVGRAAILGEAGAGLVPRFRYTGSTDPEGSGAQPASPTVPTTAAPKTESSTRRKKELTPNKQLFLFAPSQRPLSNPADGNVKLNRTCCLLAGWPIHATISPSLTSTGQSPLVTA